MMVTAAQGQVIAERWNSTDVEVLALHGWGRTHRDWRPSLGDLPVISVDLPGFGMSPPPPTTQGSAWYAQQVSGLLDSCDPVVVVGHSFGGRVAVHLAAAFPDRVRGIVLTGAPLMRTTAPVRPSLKVRLAKALASRGLVPAAVLERLKKNSGSADYRAAQGVMRDVLVTVLHEDYTEQLRSITCPVHLVWGQHDTAAPVSVAHAISEIVQDAEITIVGGQAHALSGELGDHIRRAVDDLRRSGERPA